MNETLTRAISGFVYIAILITAIYISQNTFIALLFIFACITIWEFKKLIQEKSLIPYFQLVIVFVILFNPEENVKKTTFLTLSLITLVSHSYLGYKLFKLEQLKKRSFYKQLLPLTYLITPFALLGLIPSVVGEYNPNIIFGILLIIWSNDTFAYLVGKNFGKRKLFEKVSPKKTIEGFLGGLIFGIIAGLIMAFTTPVISAINWIILSLITAIAGTIGDLVASKFKREANSKDSSNLIPGHGGFLDRLDSLIFVSSFVYLYLQILNYVS